MTARKSNTWAHALRRMPTDEAERCLRLGWTCQGGRPCPNPPTHEASYRFVTGRAGRTSTRRTHLCDEHAAKFAAKYDVTATETAAQTRAIDAAVRDAVNWMDGGTS